MRDIALTLLVIGGVLLVFKHPVVGAYLWAWLSLMTPHKLTFGFAYRLPFAQVVAAVTLLAFVMTRKRQSLPLNVVSTMWLLLFFWMSVTSLFAIAQPEQVLDRWIFVVKVFLMLLISLMLISEHRHFRWLVWVVTLSVAFYGTKGGVFTITSGGGGRVWGPPGGLLQGNNELAVGLVMVVPYLYWMRETIAHKWARRGLMASMALCVLSILGSQSRGAFLAIFAMATMMALKSRHRIRMIVLLVVGLGAAIAFMPDSWTRRMDTIQTFEQDSSAMSRVYTWTTLWNAAVDRPLVGAGFRADNLAVFRRYSPTDERFEQFRKEDTVLVAHSIYFQALGEHGFVGLFLFIGLWVSTWISAGRLARAADRVPDLSSWLPLLMRMTQVSIVGYLVGGAFLSLAYLDLAYYLMGYVLLAAMFIRQAVTEVAPTQAATRPAMPGQAMVSRVNPQ